MAFGSKPKFVTFDMNGTLIHFRINEVICRDELRRDRDHRR